MWQQSLFVVCCMQLYIVISNSRMFPLWPPRGPNLYMWTAAGRDHFPYGCEPARRVCERPLRVLLCYGFITQSRREATAIPVAVIVARVTGSLRQPTANINLTHSANPIHNHLNPIPPTGPYTFTCVVTRSAWLEKLETGILAEGTQRRATCVLQFGDFVGVSSTRGRARSRAVARGPTR